GSQPEGGSSEPISTHTGLSPALRRLLSGRPGGLAHVRGRPSTAPADKVLGLCHAHRPTLLATGQADDLPRLRQRMDRAPARWTLQRGGRGRDGSRWFDGGTWPLSFPRLRGLPRPLPHADSRGVTRRGRAPAGLPSSGRPASRISVAISG